MLFYIVLYYFNLERNVNSFTTTTTSSSSSSSSSSTTALTSSTYDRLETNTINYHHNHHQQQQNHHYHHNNYDIDIDKEQYIHIVLSFDSMTIPQAMVAISSIITTSLQPKRLYFHLILINMYWDSKFINDFQLCVGKSYYIIILIIIIIIILLFSSLLSSLLS